MPTEFAEYLLRIENMLIVACVWVLMTTIRRSFPRLGESQIWARLSPIIPIILCSGLVWVPGAVEGSVSTRIMVGVVLGAMAANGHKILKQTALGDDHRVRGRGGL